MAKAKQLSFQKTHWQHKYCHGGILRQKRAGRGARPLSTKDPLHLIFKANKDVIKGGFRTYRRFALIHHLLQKYQAKFFIKIEQISIQGDHLHLAIRTSRRSLYQSFFRVMAGQIAQVFEKEGLLTVAAASVGVTGTAAGASVEGEAVEPRLGKVSQAVGLASQEMSSRKAKRLWKYRPFTRVVKGWKAYQIVRDYIQLNEQEALGNIPYRKDRLKGMSSADWEILWS